MDTNKTRISRITIGRLVNLGNYEHIRYEVTAEIAPDDDPVAVLRHIEGALDTFADKCPVSDWQLASAIRILEQPEHERAPFDQDRLDEYRQTVSKYQTWRKRQESARDSLRTLGLSSEYVDHKLNWDED